MHNDIKIKALMHRVGLLTGLPDAEVENIINSQYAFIKSTIEDINFKEVKTKEELDAVKTNFVLKYLGKLYTNFNTLQNINNKRKIAKKRNKTNGSK